MIERHPNKHIKKAKPRVALVLGGGGARGLAHVGVIEVLQKNNIPIDLIVGTSIGSIVGALYADNGSINEIKHELLALTQKDVVEFSLMMALKGVYDSTKGIMRADKLVEFLNTHLRSRSFEELKTPLVAIATNLENGKIVCLDRGALIPAITASYSIPWLFPPVSLYDMQLVDGGVAAPLAVSAAAEYDPELIIAVELVLPVTRDTISNPLDLVIKSMNITYNSLSAHTAKGADVIIKPVLPSGTIFSDKYKPEIYYAGIIAAERALPQIKAKLNSLSKKKSLMSKLKQALSNAN